MKFKVCITYIFGLSIVSGCSTAPKQTAESPYTAAETSYQLGAGVRQYDERNFTAAIKHFKSALEIEPQNPIAHYELALTYMQLQRNNECISLAKKGLKNPGSVKENLTGLLATCHSQAGNVKQAIRHYKTALRSSPHAPELHYNIAVSYTKIKNGREAIYHFQEAIKYKPDYASPYLALGEIYGASNQRAIALAYFMKFGMLEPNTARTQIAASRIASLPYNGISTDTQSITVNLVADQPYEMLSVDIALQLIAISATPQDKRISAQSHVEVLTKFVALSGEMAANSLDKNNSFVWKYALSDLVGLYEQDRFLPFARNLTDLAGFRKSI